MVNNTLSKPSGSGSNKLLEKAAQQILGECLGFDEGRAYYLILMKKDKDVEKEFSYSKKYRLLKNLFALGAIGKIKPHDREFFGYIPMPPSFLKKKKVNAPKSVVLFLEELYAENHRELIEKTKFSQIILKDLDGFVLFLLKHIMSKNARISGTNLNSEHLKALFGEDKEKKKISSISITPPEIETRHIGIIDNCIGFELLKIKGKKTDDFIGYIASKSPKENNAYVDAIEAKFA